MKNMAPPPDMADIDAKIEKLQADKDLAVRNADYEKAASLRDEAQKALDEKATIQQTWNEENRIDRT